MHHADRFRLVPSARASSRAPPANVRMPCDNHKWACRGYQTPHTKLKNPRAVHTLKRRVALIALLLSGVAVGLPAQRRAEGSWRFVADPFAGLHFFGSVRASVSAVAGVGNGDLDVPDPSSRFLLAVAEPGWRGGRLSLAFVQWFGLKGALMARTSLLRFWDNRAPGTLAGAELQWIISVLPLGVRLGAFRPLREGATRQLLWLADFSVMY